MNEHVCKGSNQWLEAKEVYLFFMGSADKYVLSGHFNELFACIPKLLMEGDRKSVV